MTILANLERLVKSLIVTTAYTSHCVYAPKRLYSQHLITWMSLEICLYSIRETKRVYSGAQTKALAQEIADSDVYMMYSDAHTDWNVHVLNGDIDSRDKY